MPTRPIKVWDGTAWIDVGVTAPSTTGFVLTANNLSDVASPSTALSNLGGAPLVSPSLTTPSLGAATATSINKTAITAPANSATLSIADGTTLSTTGTANVTLSQSTAGVTTTMPGTSGQLALTSQVSMTSLANVNSSTAATTVQIAYGATTSGATKTINIGGNGVSGSTTVVTLGSAVSGATNNITLYGNVTLPATTTVTGGITSSMLADGAVTAAKGAVPLIMVPPVVSGNYYSCWSATTSAYASPNGTARLQPTLLRAGTLVRIGCHVTVAGSAGSVVRLGIFNSDSTGKPADLLLDAGTVDGTSTGALEITISQAITDGLYFLLAVNQGAPTTTATIRENGNVFTPSSVAVAAANATITGANYQSWYSTITGALPSSAASWTFGINSPHKVFVRY